MLARLAGGRARSRKPRGLVLVPTRELAMQVSDSLEPLVHVSGLRIKLVAGGLSYTGQTAALDKGVDVLIATPGRLVDLLDRGAVDGAVTALALPVAGGVWASLAHQVWRSDGRPRVVDLLTAEVFAVLVIVAGFLWSWATPAAALAAAAGLAATALVDSVAPRQRFVAWAVGKNKPRLVAALNSGLDAIIAEMRGSRASERQGRIIDRDGGASMEEKKQEGYF